jgi:uncharacterized protein (DUF58 family)
MSGSPDREGSSLLDPEFRRKLDVLDLVIQKVQGRDIRGERPSRERGIGTLFSDHRAYTPGDDLRYLDWNVYGRLGIPMTKEFEAETSLHMVLLIDASASMAFGSPSKLDQACRLAAAFGYIALRRMDRVSLVVLGEEAPPPRRFQGKGTIPGLLRALDGIRSAGKTDLASRVRLGLGSVRHAGMAIVLSDFLDRRGFAPVLGELSRHRLRTLALHVVSPEEEDPRVRGSLRLVDSEEGDMRTVHVDRRLLQRYREVFERHVRELERFCAGREIGYLRVSTAVPFDTPLLTLLRRGGLVR